MQTRLETQTGTKAEKNSYSRAAAEAEKLKTLESLKNLSAPTHYKDLDRI